MDRRGHITHEVKHRTAADRDYERMPVNRDFDEAALQALDKSGIILAALAPRDEFRRGDQLHRMLVDRRISHNTRREVLRCGQAVINEDHHLMTAIRLEACERFDKDLVRGQEKVACERDGVFVTDRELLQIGVSDRSMEWLIDCRGAALADFNFGRALFALLKRHRDGPLWRPRPTRRREQGSGFLPLSLRERQPAKAPYQRR